MTLVLPFGFDQIAGNSLFSAMPCVFDSDAFERDFESALMRDWTSEICDYDSSAEESTVKTPSGIKSLKRRTSTEELEDDSSSTKKSRFESSPDNTPSDVSPAPSSPPPFDADDASSPASSSSSSSSPEEEENSPEEEEEEEEYLPRRRGIQMWNSRQRWKDERKRVMKMSVTKLSEIDDPELCLLRSVLINNTIRRLHSDIRSERQAKLKHRQQRMDLFAERFPQFVQPDFPPPKPDTRTSSPADFYEENSCDEMFGLGEDFLRVVPDRRVSSPIPCRTPEPMDVDPSPPANSSCYTSSNTTNSCDSASPSYYQRRSHPAGGPIQTVPPSLKQIIASVSSSSTQPCATQYRTNRDCGGESSFPPRVPILDEVVYHSLLASLES